MKFLPLIWSGIWRKPGRTVLIFLQVCVAFALFGVLQGLKTGVEHVIGEARADLLLVHGSLGLVDPLPLSLLEQIKSIRDVKAVIPVELSLATYQNPNQKVGMVAIRPDENWLSAFTFTIASDAVAAFRKTRTGAIIKVQLAKKYGWKVGDHIHVSSPSYFGVGVDLILRGIYDSDEEHSYLVFHWDYLNDVLGSPNVTGQFWILANSADLMPSLMKTVDAQFRNETVQTRTQTVKQFVLNFISWLGNVKLILLSVSAAVVFAVLLIVANTMAMSIRERTTELAVLRALGFPTNTLLTLLTAESLVISLVGASAGCLAAWAICRAVAGYALGGGLLVNLEIGLTGGLSALGVAILTSLLSTLVPAYRASRMSIAEALRYTG